MTSIDTAAIRNAVAEVGVIIGDSEATALLQHMGAVRDANRRFNLTRIEDPGGMLRLHVADSLAFLPHVPDLQGPIVDLGSGAGYPGIPLAVVLRSHMILCESTQKKAQFLESVVEDLALDADVVPERAEVLAQQRPRFAGTVVARAVSSLGALAELAAPLLRTGGLLIALKGTPPPDELARVARIAPLCGMAPVMVEGYQLPGGEQRSVYVYQKESEPSVPLPRRPGLAQRQPLA
ncbi:MAG: 16S rRNA (guanine(527)-N(7))-methyltransferase RsmG [Coriobacteriia bacterium]|nr:16S rRNA (guanine(527)-N(7))-methyltransferase RsmG [Coriobacteriia bacterium]